LTGGQAKEGLARPRDRLRVRIEDPRYHGVSARPQPMMKLGPDVASGIGVTPARIRVRTMDCVKRSLSVRPSTISGVRLPRA
jgi:hypothetical protein